MWMWISRSCLVLTIALVAAGCGSSTQLETAANPTAATAADPVESVLSVPEPSEAPDPAAPTSTASVTVTSIPPVLASADDTRSLPEGPICDWLYAAEFSGAEAWVNFEAASLVEVAIDDYADKNAAMCVDDTLVPGPDGYDYSLLLRVEDGRLLVESGTWEWAGAIEATDYTTWDEAVAQEPWPKGFEDAAETAMLAIEALVSNDLALYESLLAPQLLWIEDHGPVNRADIVAGQAEVGFPDGQDHSTIQMRDYLANYQPTVSPIDALGEDAVSAFEALAPGANLAVFWGNERKPDGEAILWDDLLTFVLAGDSDGWRIIGI